MHRLPVILFFSTIFQATAGFTWAGPMDVLSEREAARGLRDALVLAAEKAVSRLGQEDGFLLNEKVRIPLPDGLERLDSPLRRFGMGHYADEPDPHHEPRGGRRYARSQDPAGGGGKQDDDSGREGPPHQRR